ncbi:tRNA-dihydrouridine(20a/20b) synthase [NAD(P)+]-like [Clytia hemisphaerica]|uniref:tRNA-dihydrouridine synthase n=1 Tax=Clytia hemisphaerica TaxID=252671 RepID=A0A7M5V7U0_9CNID
MSVLDLFEEKDVVKVCAPMVRYSKQAFRHLVRSYGCDIAYTPMIISESFVQSKKARDVEFTTNAEDRPLIVQFAASKPKDFADAAEMVKPYSDGVGLNCGCPQRWAMAEGYGSYLMEHGELVKDIVLQTKQRVGFEFPCEVKIRIHKDSRKTIEFCQRAERAGADWITVHGRTPKERKEPVHYDVIKLIKESIGIPVVANGDIKSEEDVLKVKELTNVDGVMAAQGMLNNPAMYAGYDITPMQCVEDWMDIALRLGTPFRTFHHHLMYMTDSWHTKSERMVFNNLSSVPAVLNFLEVHYGIT